MTGPSLTRAPQCWARSTSSAVPSKKYEVPNEIRLALEEGETLERLDDHYAPNALDDVWIPEVGAKGWVVLTQEARFGAAPLRCTLCSLPAPRSSSSATRTSVGNRSRAPSRPRCPHSDRSASLQGAAPWQGQRGGQGLRPLGGRVLVRLARIHREQLSTDGCIDPRSALGRHPVLQRAPIVRNHHRCFDRPATVLLSL